MEGLAAEGEVLPADSGAVASAMTEGDAFALGGLPRGLRGVAGGVGVAVGSAVATSGVTFTGEDFVLVCCFVGVLEVTAILVLLEGVRLRSTIGEENSDVWGVPKYSCSPTVGVKHCWTSQRGV